MGSKDAGHSDETLLLDVNKKKTQKNTTPGSTLALYFLQRIPSMTLINDGTAQPFTDGFWNLFTAFYYYSLEETIHIDGLIIHVSPS